MSGECDYCGEHPVDGCTPDCTRPRADNVAGEPALIHPDEFHPERLNEPACALCGNDARHPIHPTGHEFTSGEHTTAPPSPVSSVSIDDVHRAVYPPPASKGAQGDGVLAQLPNEGCGAFQIRNDGRWWVWRSGEWRPYRLASPAESKLAALLNAALAREAEAKREAAIAANERALWRQTAIEIEQANEETKRGLNAARRDEATALSTAEWHADECRIAMARAEEAEQRATEAEEQATTAKRAAERRLLPFVDDADALAAPTETPR